MSDLRVAMCSGPFKEALCLMRAWGNRADTFVIHRPSADAGTKIRTE